MDRIQVFQSAYNIPIEIIVEILSWLPVKSLLRFKCVCKSWRSLISNGDFVQKHLDRMLSMNKNHLLISTSLKKPLQTVSIRSLLNFKDHHSTDIAIKLPLQLNEMDEICTMWPMGSCNGLVLLLSPFTNKLLLLNPSTRKSKMLPDADETNGERTVNYLGFGYDQISNDYKVVEVVENCDGRPKKVLLYSLRKNSWRRIEDFPRRWLDFHPVLLDNSLVWFDRWNRNLISFDLDKEVFQQLPFPEDLKYPAPTKIAATLLASYLFILYTDLNVNLSKMNEYEVKEYLSKMTEYEVEESTSSNGEGITDPYMGVPVSEIMNDALVFISLRGFEIYNMKSAKLFTGALLDKMKLCRAEIYMETLVSVNGE